MEITFSLRKRHDFHKSFVRFLYCLFLLILYYTDWIPQEKQCHFSFWHCFCKTEFYFFLSFEVEFKFSVQPFFVTFNQMLAGGNKKKKDCSFLLPGSALDSPFGYFCHCSAWLLCSGWVQVFPLRYHHRISGSFPENWITYFTQLT